MGILYDLIKGKEDLTGTAETEESAKSEKEEKSDGKG